MDTGLISKRYAKALWLCAKDVGQDSDIYKILTLLSENFSNNSSLASVLQNPTLTMNQKQLLINTACANSKNQLFSRFTDLILENQREGELQRIALTYCDLYRKASNIYIGKLTTAVPIDKTTENAIKKRIEKEGKMLEFQKNVNPELLGGFILDVEDERLDASILNQLRIVKNKLVK